jgi:hypothetical protein
MTREEWRTTLRNLSSEELRELSTLVREEYLAREARHASELRIGDLVEFQDRAGKTVQGTLVRVNARSVSVHCCPAKGHEGSEEKGTYWRLTPSLVRRVPPTDARSKELA